MIELIDYTKRTDRNIQEMFLGLSLDELVRCIEFFKKDLEDFNTNERSFHPNEIRASRWLLKMAENAYQFRLQ